jgi:hypothetical protein
MGIDVRGVLEFHNGKHWNMHEAYYDGTRGLIRYWLGWGRGYYETGLGISRLVTSIRGLPNDFDPENPLIGSIDKSWLAAEEILGALPLIGHEKCDVVIELAYTLWKEKAGLQEWNDSTGIGNFFTHRGVETPQLETVNPLWETYARDTNSIQVECTFDFSTSVSDITEKLVKLKQEYKMVRFVYGFE